ncbi:MAG TPA: peptidylprolyl isomerase [Thermoanaerobaculia bacterium]|nr:peptidylprolyl isomerase [Thermoanaerobaculia bacterium]
MTRDLSLAAVVIIAIAALCFGAVKMHPLAPPPPSPVVATAASAAGAGTGAGVAVPAPKGPVIMTVNGEPVTEEEFQLFLSTLPDNIRLMANQSEPRNKIAEQFVRMKVVEQEARRLGADKDPDVQSKMASDHTNVLVEYALKKFATAPPESQVRAEYEKHKGEFSAAELSHILVAYQGGQIPPKSGPPLPEAQAAQKAEAIEAKLRSGALFGPTAAQFSDDQTTGVQGGKLGEVQPGMLPPELQAVVDGLKPGEISQPVKSQFGIHIFRLDSRRAAPYEQARATIIRKLQQDAVATAVDKLEKSARVEKDLKYFSAGTPIVSPPKPQG